MTLLDADQLTYTTKSGATLLKSVSFALGNGEIIGLVGGNGAGKSTLLKLLAGITQPSSGALTLQNKPLDSYSAQTRSQNIAYIAQQTNCAWPLTVYQTVAMGRIPHGVAMHKMKDRDALIVDQALKACRIDFLKDRMVGTLSGGEAARVWLARALATGAPILLADEPTAGLDMHYQLMFMELLQSWRQEGKGAIVAIHDLSLAARFCDKLLVLTHGAVAGFDAPDALIQSNLLSRAFGVKLHHMMIDGVPVLSAYGRIEGECA